jgi:flagellar hook assembly protein FlgD
MPSGYVSGNTTAFPHLGLPGNYFAFDVGDLRIRALDPYLFSTTRPHNGHGELNGSLNGWDWELGLQQYNWLESDLLTHARPYSLVALHHLTSCYTGSGQYYGRGGIEIAKFAVDSRPSFEWGGEDESGQNVLESQRSEYVHGAVHDVLKDRGNQVVLKGHDHFHARQSLDEMTYVTLAKPDDTGTNTGNLWGWRFFAFYPEEVTFFAPNSGFLSIMTGESSAVYSYIQTFPEEGRGTTLDSFTIFPAVQVGSGPPPVSILRTSIDLAAPNPTRDQTRIVFTLAKPGKTRLELVNAAGRSVRVLSEQPLAAGTHEVIWDGLDVQGKRVSAGIYFAKLSGADGRVDSVKMVVLN